MRLQLLKEFSPWLVFSALISSNTTTVLTAAIAALVLSVRFGRANLKKKYILDLGTIGFFVILIISQLLPNSQWFAQHANFISNVALGAIMWFSIIVGMPFTMQYAKEKVPSEHWTSPTFINIGYSLSIAWALALTVLTLISYLNEFHIDQAEWLVQVLPIIIILACIQFTSWFPKFYKNLD